MLRSPHDLGRGSSTETVLVREFKHSHHPSDKFKHFLCDRDELLFKTNIPETYVQYFAGKFHIVYYL